MSYQDLEQRDDSLCSPNGSRDTVDVTDVLPDLFDTFPAEPVKQQDSGQRPVLNNDDPDHWNPVEGGNKASDDYW